MLFLYILLSLIFAALTVSVSATLICYFKIFFSPKRKELSADEYDIPDGEIYEKYRDEMIGWMKSAREMNPVEYKIKSYDGLDLYAKYYEYKKGAPIEILFHGYKGSAERDLSGGIERCFSLGRNAFIVDQRAHGKSGGHTITFGIKERFDCVYWANFVNETFGKDSKIILTGISMGAATVMMASAEKLPENVVCILADCGYSSPRKIIEKVIIDLSLPPKLLMPFVTLAAKLIGKFDLDESTPLCAVSATDIPLIFIHGDDDDFVPYYMSEECFNACKSQKKLVKVTGAGHGLAFPVDKTLYLSSLQDFQNECGF